MNGNGSILGWVVGVVIAIIVIGIGFAWWTNTRQADVVAQPEAGQATTTATKPASVVMVNKVDRSTQSVAAVVAGLSGATRFQSLFTSTGVAASLSSSGTYTVFVPMDASFALLPANALKSLSASALKRLIQYHVVSGRKLDVNAVDSGTIMALSKDALNFEAEGVTSSARVNSSDVIAQYKAKNGIVYVITGVLIPPVKAQ